MDERFMRSLERIASALERIADSLDRQNINISKVGIKEESFPTFMNNEEQDKIQSEVITERRHIIEEFLSNHKVTIRHIPPENEGDKLLDEIAVFIGNRYNLVRSFLEQIKNKMNSGEYIKMLLKDKTQEEISSICQLATNLHTIAFLEEYKYQKSPKYVLFARPNRIPKALNFFSGQWLERFIRSEVVSLIRKVNPYTKFSYISNPLIKLPNGDDFELDILFEIEGEIFWFEAKSGDYQRYIEKYSRFSKILNLDIDHCYMILTDITPAGAQALRGLFNMKVVRIEDFHEEFLKSLEKFSDVKESIDNNLQNTVG